MWFFYVHSKIISTIFHFGFIFVLSLLHKTINFMENITEVKAFLNEVVDKLGGGFHPDNDFSDYVNADGRTFTDMEAAVLDQRMEDAIICCDANGADIYELGLKIFQERGFMPNDMIGQLEIMSKEQLIQWLYAQDKDGTFSDEEQIAQGMERGLTHSELLELAKSYLD